MYILSFTLFESLPRSREVSSTTFCTLEKTLRSREVSSTTVCRVEKTLHLLYHFSGVHLGTRPLESRRQVKKAVRYLLTLGL